MLRTVTLSLLVICCGSSLAVGQEWADKMFKIRRHDFGTVARNSKQEFAFELQNVYKEPIHITGVRASCGCTTPSVTKKTLGTWETGAVVAKFNTDSFLGQKSATLTVTIDKPYPAEVQLQVSGYIRSDVVFNPGIVDFGEIDPGTVVEKKVQLLYAGRDDWSVKDIRSNSEHVEVEMKPLARGGGRVNYELTVRLKDNAPAGYLADHLYIVTNEGRGNIPLAVSGRVIPAVTVSPASLFMGSLETNQSVTKQLIVRAKKPFRITSVNCDDAQFTFAPQDEAKELHIVPVTFVANAAGKVACKIMIETDLPGGAAEFVASATVADAAPPQVANGN
jgi:hypothetical protein